MPFADNDTDAFDQIAVHTYYDPDDLLESVDAFASSLICFDGLPLIGAEVEALLRQLSDRGYEQRSLVFETEGFQLSESDGKVDGVLVFRPGYYDISNPNSAASRARRAAEKWLQVHRER